MSQVAFLYYLCLLETRNFNLTKNDGEECESMDKQQTIKFQAAEASCILRY